ncbi:MAG: hypothetical protein ACLVJI_09155 [Bacilli bacterium]
MPLAEHYLLRVGALLADVNAFFWVVDLPALQVEPFDASDVAISATVPLPSLKGSRAAFLNLNSATL